MRRMYSKPQLLEAVEQESKLNGIKVFENIVDKDGHNRFVEGDIAMASDSGEGITKAYGKWSLSGSHLMIVFALNIEAGASITDNKFLGELKDLPSWIFDKIVSIAYGIIENKTFSAYSSSFNAINFGARIVKDTANRITIYKSSDYNVDTSSRMVRMSYDLLIDNE